MSDRRRLLDRLLRRHPGVPLAAGHLPPKKVAWLNPLQLLRTGYHVWLITARTGILDRREMLAVLDRRTVRDTVAPGTVLNAGTEIDAVFADPARAATDGVWLDFLADVGDSWEATYAVASLLVDPCLRRRFPPSATTDVPETFKAADIVVVGGDLVYPVASRARYRRRFRAPFAAVFPDTARRRVPAMFAIPGNNDWYGGLTNFCREFCRGGAVGGWRLFQRRSYFAVKLTRGWWLWGIDIALDTRIDAPQQAYFLRILEDSAAWDDTERFAPGDNVILCSSKPAWVETSRYSDDAFRELVDFVKMIEDHRGNVPVILTGDLHHYSRYVNAADRQLIASGGGGAYLMGTHFLPDRVSELIPPQELEADRAAPPPSRDRAKPAPGSEFIASGFAYPSRADSRRLALGALLLPFRPANWPFCLLAGAVYWLMAPDIRPPGLPSAPDHTVRGFFALPQWIWRHPGAANMYLVIAVMLMCALLAIFINNRASRLLTTIWGTLHGAVHVWLAVGIAWFLAPYWIAVAATLRRTPLWSVEQYALPAMFVLIAGLIAGTVAGIYLVISDRFFDLHHNDVFAVQSLIDYRNFVRLHIRPDGVLEIYPIGLRRVPRRWRRRIDPEKHEPLFEPADEKILPHLIEGPIRIKPVAAPLAAGSMGAPGCLE